MNDLTSTQNPSTSVTSTDDLSRVVRKALQQLEDIIDMKLPKADEKVYAKILSVKKDAATTIINAGLKADENRFRRENKDIIERLFAKMQNHGKIVDGTVKK